jgi:hypothetical protein
MRNMNCLSPKKMMIGIYLVVILSVVSLACAHSEEPAPEGFQTPFMKLTPTKNEGTKSTQAAPLSTPDLSKVSEIYVFGNDKAVYNGATAPTKFTNEEPWYISRLYTYHWNDAQGTTPLGTIALQSDNGTLYGPWETTPEDGQGGVPNAYWIASPKITIPAGTYTVIDSDPSTWSQNKQSGGAGMVWIDGIRLSN